MVDKAFTVLDLLELDLPGHDALNLTCIAGRRGLPRLLSVPDINRPGLALTGFYESFAYQRVQLFGHGEVAYLNKLHESGSTATLKALFKYDIPCCVFSYSLKPPEEFLAIAENMSCPILQTSLESTEFLSRLVRVLSNIFAPKKTMHGVLVEVSGMGILLIGHSGVGKSEIALTLIERGNRLVADDIIELRCVNGNTLFGQGANTLISHHMEIRGLGIINVAQLYGVGAVRNQKEVQLVVKLEDWDPNKTYDRLGTDQKYTDILGVKIPFIEIPVRPGRNLPVIIETAAMNERLKRMGYNSARDFNQNVLRWIETGEAQTAYTSDEDSY
ncbi:MAG: HPr kinase/phosphorylase [Treponema sp.]|nr:HPr kinase/phosphorylase [Treponema sp.]